MEIVNKLDELRTASIALLHPGTMKGIQVNTGHAEAALLFNVSQQTRLKPYSLFLMRYHSRRQTKDPTWLHRWIFAFNQTVLITC